MLAHIDAAETCARDGQLNIGANSNIRHVEIRTPSSHRWHLARRHPWQPRRSGCWLPSRASVLLGWPAARAHVSGSRGRGPTNRHPCCYLSQESRELRACVPLLLLAVRVRVVCLRDERARLCIREATRCRPSTHALIRHLRTVIWRSRVVESEARGTSKRGQIISHVVNLASAVLAQHCHIITRPRFQARRR